MFRLGQIVATTSTSFTRPKSSQILKFRSRLPVLNDGVSLKYAARNLSTDAKNDRLVHFICGDQTFTGKAKLGDSLLDVVIDNDLPLDGYGACEGTLACCTCHVILSKEHFERVDKTNPAGEEELDMLDLAPELSDQSRLGCQIRVEKEDGPEITVTMPMVRRDARQN